MQIEIHTRSEELPLLLPGNINHSALMFKALEQNGSSKPYMLVARENGKEQAHLIIIKQRGVRLFPPMFGFWYTIYGEGVYAEECTRREEIFALFIARLFDMFDIRHQYIEIKTIENPRFAYATLSRRNFVPVRDHRIYISLHSKPPVERLSKSHRTCIRKAQERGATYRTANNAEEIERGLLLLKNYYKSKIRRPFPSTDILRSLLIDEKGGMRTEATLFIVEYKGKIIGCSICTYDNDKASLAYSCGLRKSHPRHYPGILSVWAAVEDAYNKKLRHFEFLESRTLAGIGAGFRNFILDFGGKQISTYRWYHFKWNFLNKILLAIYV